MGFCSWFGVPSAVQRKLVIYPNPMKPTVKTKRGKVKAKNGQTSCCIIDCGAYPRGGRGLCGRHYNSLNHHVRRGNTTWKLLEQTGIIMPLGSGRYSRTLIRLMKEKGALLPSQRTKKRT